MDDTLDIGHQQYARFTIPGGRILIHYDTVAQQLVIVASEGVTLHPAQTDETTLRVSADRLST
jgi:hypothetical protein